MKIEQQENSISLVPENQYEIEAPKRLRTRPITSKVFQDDWNETGALYLKFQTDDEAWGRRM
jgi:hypothetical protein